MRLGRIPAKLRPTRWRLWAYGTEDIPNVTGIAKR